MPECLICKEKFPNRFIYNGKVINLQRRKYCPTCSPIGQHNTKILDDRDRKTIIKDYNCGICGETDKTKFYGNKKRVCGACHNEYTLKRGQDKRKWAVDQLGGCCKNCGYNKYYGAIDIHHLNPELKDEKFTQLRGWSKERILKEIQQCVALCKNCHAEVHAKLVDI